MVLLLPQQVSVSCLGLTLEIWGNSAEIMIYNMKDHERIFNMVRRVLYSTNVVHLFTLCNKMQYSSSISSH